MGKVQLEQIFQRDDVPSEVKEIVMDHLDESKKDKEILRKTEAKLRAILEAIPDLMFQVSEDGTYLSYKGAKEDLYSVPEEFLGKKIAEVMSKEIAEPTMHCIERTLQTGELQIMNLQMPIAGKNRDFDLRMVPCGEDEVMTIVREITTELALRESEERLRAFMDAATDNLYLIDSDLNIVDINKIALNILNLKKINVVGRNITEFLPDVKKSGRVDKYLEVIKTGEPLLEENIVYHPPFLSHPKYLSVRSFKVGKGLGIISTDITERIKVEKTKEDLEKKRSAFVSMMSHELRTPITVIKGYTEFLDKNIENIDSVRKTQAIQSISQNVLRLERLIKGVSDITRMEQGIFKLETTVINFSKFLKESTRPYKEFYEKKFSTHGTLEFDSPVFLNIDIDHMRQVLDNLIDNANKQTPDDGRIIFTPTILSNTVQIAISDTGIGIDSSVLERIFEQFVSIPTEQASGGTGIGLYVSRTICEAHEGTLTAHSEGKNQGATFLIELPRWLE